SPQLTGAFTFPGPYPALAQVSYRNPSGQTINSRAYAGQIQVLVAAERMDAAGATSLFRANNGTVIGQIPSSGLYWVQVATGAEAAFIGAIQTNTAVIFAGPNVPVTAAPASVVDLSG